ncbi:MAG: YrhB domain-containing protein [Polyangiaceae bacterium]
MERDDARAAVAAHLRRRGVGGTDGIAIIDSQTIEKPYGWVFYYNSRRYVESGDLVYALVGLVGQGPVVVFAASGEIVELGSAVPAEAAIRQLEDSRQIG